jgi:hypothetical protein
MVAAIPASIPFLPTIANLTSKRHPQLAVLTGEVSFMDHPSRRIALFGATGSIGRSTLDVVRHSAGELQVVALSRIASSIVRQAANSAPFVVATDEQQPRN